MNRPTSDGPLHNANSKQLPTKLRKPCPVIWLVISKMPAIAIISGTCRKCTVVLGDSAVVAPGPHMVWGHEFGRMCARSLEHVRTYSKTRMPRTDTSKKNKMNLKCYQNSFRSQWKVVVNIDCTLWARRGTNVREFDGAFVVKLAKEPMNGSYYRQ